MGLINFLIVLGFNLFYLWLCSIYRESYIKLYSWSESKLLSVSLWGYALWGLANLVYTLIYLFQNKTLNL